MKTVFHIIFLLTIFSLFQCDILEPKENTIDIDAEIEAEMKSRHIPSVVACIIKDNEIVWQQAYGYANVQQEIPATSSTIYTLMSVSKLVLATAVMQLWEDGRLDLDEDINQYLPFSVRNPHFPNHEITIRMLMTHTSGLAHPDNEVTDWYKMYTDDRPPLMAEWIDQWLIPGGAYYDPDTWKNRPPGTRELYSNIATWLLAFIVEQVSGEEYTSYCTNHILKPLRMFDSGFWLSELAKEHIATPYITGYKAIQNYNSLAYPVGWLRSSTTDFSRFLMAYMNGGILDGERILDESTVEKMLKVQNPKSGICLIWHKWLGAWYGHDGGGTGFSSRAEFNRDEKIGIIILSNIYRDYVHPGGRIHELIRLQANRFR